MSFELTCSCGRKLVVTAGDAGAEVRCECGRALEVPDLRTLQMAGQPPETGEDLIQSSYYYAANSMRDGVPAHQIVNKLVERGLSPEVAETIIKDLKQAITNSHKEAGRKNMLYGALWCGGGVLVTLVTYAMAEGGGGKFLLAWGAILFGGIQFVRGYTQATNNE